MTPTRGRSKRVSDKERLDAVLRWIKTGEDIFYGPAFFGKTFKGGPWNMRMGRHTKFYMTGRQAIDAAIAAERRGKGGK